MNDLTEKLKAGELYYVKKKNGKIVIRQAYFYSCLRKENEQLKKLLKRINEHFEWIDRVEPFYINDELWEDIKKAIGEK